MKSRILTIVPAFFGISCAAIFGGTSQTVSVQSAAPGRTVVVDGSRQCATPCDIELTRNAPHDIVVVGVPQWGVRDSAFRMEQDLRYGMLVLDILFTGFIGLIVDGVTGSWHNLDPVGVPCQEDTANGCAEVMVP